MADQLKVQELQKSNLNVHELTINYSIVHDFDLHTNGSKRSIKVHELYELFSQLWKPWAGPHPKNDVHIHSSICIRASKMSKPNWSGIIKSL